MDEKMKAMLAKAQELKSRGMSPLVTFVMLAGLIKLLKDRGLITWEDLVASIELFLNMNAPEDFRGAAETAMLLCDDALLEMLFFPQQHAPRSD